MQSSKEIITYNHSVDDALIERKGCTILEGDETQCIKVGGPTNTEGTGTEEKKDKATFLSAEYLNHHCSECVLLEEVKRNWVQNLVVPVKRNYFIYQLRFDPNMRGILFDWLNEVCTCFKFKDDTFHLCVTLFDAFASLVTFEDPKKRLQLIGVSALFIASKLQELTCITVEDFAYITDDTFSSGQILDTEREILKALDYSVFFPSPLLYITTHGSDDVNFLSKYLLEASRIQSESMCFRLKDLAEMCSFVAVFVLTVDASAREMLDYLILQNEDFALKVIAWGKNKKYDTVYQKYAHSSKNRVSVRFMDIFVEKDV